MSDQSNHPTSKAKGQEAIVLGALLRWPAGIDEVAPLLRHEDFSWYHHGLIYRALLDLAEAGAPVTLEAVAEELHRREQIQEIGGYAYLGELWEASPSSGNLMHFAKIVRDRAQVRRLNEAAGRIVQMTSGANGPAEELQEQAERLILGVGELGQVAGTRTMREGIELACDSYDRLAQLNGSVTGLATGLVDLDEATAGLQEGEQTIVAARPGLGKTAFALQVAKHVALNLGLPVFFASLEMSLEELAKRLLCNHARLDGHKLRRGLVTTEDGHRLAVARSELVRANIHVDDNPSQTMLHIAANARRHKRQHDIRLVIVDYLQLVQPENRRDPRHEQVGQVSRRLKILARELKVPVLALAQLNRAVEARKGERPRLSDLRESGEIEQSADVVVLLHHDGDRPREVTAIIAKQRNGPKEDITLVYEPEHTRFSNFAPPLPQGV